MDKFDVIGGAVLSAVISLLLGIICARFFFAGKPGFILLLPFAWAFGWGAYCDFKSLRK